MVKEGPKVKVGTIRIAGNQAFKRRLVIASMKNLKPYGIPHSILFENIFAKTFDQDKLEEDKERIVQAYRDHGYFTAKTLDETVKIIPKGGRGWRAAAHQDQQRGHLRGPHHPGGRGTAIPLEQNELRGRENCSARPKCS